MRRSLLALAILVALGGGLLAIGLVAFTGYVLMASEKKPPVPADGIVVVTGGSGRLEHAIGLFREGKGKKLLISGVHPNYSDHTLLTNYELTAEQIACCVDLDSRALNTVANATQTALWARKNGFKSLILVTSAYHMPRTMLEMRRAAPEIVFQSHLVTKTSKRTFIARLFNWNTAQLLAKEYGKLLASIVHGTSERLMSGKR